MSSPRTFGPWASLALGLVGALILSIPDWLLWFGPLFILGSLPIMMLGFQRRPAKEHLLLAAASAGAALVFSLLWAHIGYAILRESILAGRLAAYGFSATPLGSLELVRLGAAGGLKAVGWCALFFGAGFGLSWAQVILVRERQARDGTAAAVEQAHQPDGQQVD